MWNSLTFPWRSTTLLPMLNVTHIMPVLVLLSVVAQECNSAWSKPKWKAQSQQSQEWMQLTTKSFMPLFADKIFFPDTSLTAVKFPDISRFSRQLVTLFPGDCRTITKTKALIYICITDWLQHYVSYTVYVVYSSLYFCKQKQKIQWKNNNLLITIFRTRTVFLVQLFLRTRTK